MKKLKSIVIPTITLFSLLLIISLMIITSAIVKSRKQKQDNALRTVYDYEALNDPYTPIFSNNLLENWDFYETSAPWTGLYCTINSRQSASMIMTPKRETRSSQEILMPGPLAADKLASPDNNMFLCDVTPLNTGYKVIQQLTNKVKNDRTYYIKSFIKKKSKSTSPIQVTFHITAEINDRTMVYSTSSFMINREKFCKTSLYIPTAGIIQKFMIEINDKDKTGCRIYYAILEEADEPIRKPFPVATTYTDCIKPTASQEELNYKVIEYYENWWKYNFIKMENDLYYVESLNKYTVSSSDEIYFHKSLSSAMGQGMIITCLMAGYDDEAKIIFDGLYRMLKKCPSSTLSDELGVISSKNYNLFSYVIPEDHYRDVLVDSLAEADITIAFALLLADRQWGSDGQINYKKEAEIIIQSIVTYDFHDDLRIRLGDWNIEDDKYTNGTVTSSWAPAFLKALSSATSRTNLLNGAVNNIYDYLTTFNTLHNKNLYGNTTGLISDYINGKGSKIKPVDGLFKTAYLDKIYDGAYYYNASKFPLLLTMDYAFYSDKRAKKHLSLMLNWLKKTTENEPEKINAGYRLDGTRLPTLDEDSGKIRNIYDYYTDLNFTAPFIAACITDKKHQKYLDDGWNLIKNWKPVYKGIPEVDAATINMLTLLLITGNYWSPSSTIK